MIVERGMPQEALLSQRAVPKWEIKVISENASSQKQCVLRPTILQQELFSTLRMKITINMVAIFTAVKGKCQEFNSIYCDFASKHPNLSYRHLNKIESGGHSDSTATRGSTQRPSPPTVPCLSTPHPSRWRSRPAARPGPACQPGASGWRQAPPGLQTSDACSS